MKHVLRPRTAALMVAAALSLAAALGPAAALAPSPSATPTATAANGRYLAANCANCHGTAGASVGPMPSLSGQNAAYIAEQMRQFRDGKRPATIMHQIAKGYTDEQVAAIAAHFAAQKK